MNRTLLATATTLILACTAGAQEADDRDTDDREPVVGGPCEGCDNVFLGMPAELSSNARIALEDEPGEPLILDGTVRDVDGEPVAGVIVYAYHTDNRGIYPPGDTHHGRLRGWVETDAEGRYRFDTIRPGGYPESRAPQHIHMHVVEPGRCTYFINDIHFADDERLTDAIQRRSERGRSGSGLVTPVRTGDGPWKATRDIDLGENVPGYDRCS